MAIEINTGFQLGSKEPIDNRYIKETTTERDQLVINGLVYEGLKVYCKDTKLEYRWTGTEWEIVDGGSGGDLDLTDYQKKTDNTLDTTDKTVTGAINEINGNLLDTVGFSADYKNIILNRKNGLNPYTIPISAIINNTSLTELKDIDSTDIGNGKTLIYDGATGKHKYVGSTGTDELVKMDSTGDAHYLVDLLDKQTVINDNGILKVKKLDGQEVTITEINYLKGLTMNVMDLVSAFANGGVKVLNTPVATYADLTTLDRSAFIEGISYIVYVLADETHAGAKTTYLCDKTSSTYFGNADNQRNFITNPIDLANEVTGKLDNSHIDVDNLWTLLTINDTYKTLTTNNEIFGTHGAKAMYDELVTSIGEKANATDLTTHTGDTDIHVTTTDKAKWDKVDEKVDKNSITTTIDITSTDTQVPTARAVNELNLRGTCIDQSVIDKYGTEIIKYPFGRWYIDGNEIAGKFSDMPWGSACIIDITSPIISTRNPWDNTWAYRNYSVQTVENKGTFIRQLESRGTPGVLLDTGWQKIATETQVSSNETRLTTVETQVSELFQSVSNGKTAVANAITDKGVSTSSTATFATMATNISKITTSSPYAYKEETKSYAVGSAGINPITVTFSAKVIGIKQIIAPTEASRITNTKTSTDVFTINGKELILYVSGIGTWKVTALIKA